jgi:hypothetical protein
VAGHASGGPPSLVQFGCPQLCDPETASSGCPWTPQLSMSSMMIYGVMLGAEGGPLRAGHFGDHVQVHVHVRHDPVRRRAHPLLPLPRALRYPVSPPCHGLSLPVTDGCRYFGPWGTWFRIRSLCRNYGSQRQCQRRVPRGSGREACVATRLEVVRYGGSDRQ